METKMLIDERTEAITRLAYNNSAEERGPNSAILLESIF